MSDKRRRLEMLTALLRISTDSPEAKARAAEHQDRMDALGRQPGWSLALNPTPALRAEFGDAELARRAGRSPHRDAATAADRVDSAPDHEAPEVPRAVRLAYMGMANPNTTPICHARDVMPQRSRRSGQDRDHTRDQDRTGNAAAVPAAWIGDRVPPLRLRDLNGRYGVESPLCTAYPCRYRGVLRPQVARYV